MRTLDKTFLGPAVERPAVLVKNHERRKVVLGKFGKE